MNLIRTWLTARTCTLLLALGLAGYGATSLIGPAYSAVADVFGLAKFPVDSGIEDGSV